MATVSSISETYIGVDYHKHNFVCTFLDGSTGELYVRNYKSNTKGYEDFISELKRIKSTKMLVKVALEMLTGSYYFYDQVHDYCDEVVIINTNKFKIIATSSKKTDKVDSKTIALYYSKDLLPTVFIPEESIRILREYVSIRYKLVGNRSGFKNGIHSLLQKVGIKISKRSLGSKKTLSKLRALDIDSFRKRELNLLINQVENLNASIKEIELMMTDLVNTNEKIKEDIDILKSIPGVGDLSAKIIISGIADINRFKEEKQLAAYMGIVPRVRDSGLTVSHGKITKQGNKIVRTTLVQDALAMLKQKNGPLKGFYLNVKSRGGNGKAIIALARKIITISFVLLKNKEYFDSSKIVNK